MKKIMPPFARCVLLAAMATSTSVLHAQSPYWNNTGTDFNTGSNWDSGAVPTSIANFTSIAGTQPNLSASLAIQRVILERRRLPVTR